ncbi:MAG: cation diffusion facilitator family transporter [Bacteroidetes bacterium]|nr:cation diffusion facilitator family transporter [Bacteroidota bacterium]
MNRKVSVARLSVLSNTLLIAMKVVVGIMSGSISILSEAIHSFMDLLAAIIAFFSVRISDTPADKRHPYGHGKFENISGVVEAMLIFIASGWIILEAVRKIINPHEIEKIGLGVIVMGISALVNFFVSRTLYKVAKSEDSIALEADALHLKVDVYTSLGVAFGLLLMLILGYFTKNPLVHYLDPLIAILVALLILRESFILFKKAYAPLLDEALAEVEVEQIKADIVMYCSKTISYHSLRTRKAGNYRYVDFHLDVPPGMTVKEAHDLCDRMEEEIKKSLDHTEVTIHVESK